MTYLDPWCIVEPEPDIPTPTKKDIYDFLRPELKNIYNLLNSRNNGEGYTANQISEMLKIDINRVRSHLTFLYVPCGLVEKEKNGNNVVYYKVPLLDNEETS
ncbi:MAG: helix-turn-helix transcriptional regulator [Candidatus Aenigmarchaeota archaeon]|nr:helix-turn-helix transcriptional regulator [Candidatus Aenigmarchaeota archaeon]